MTNEDVQRVNGWLADALAYDGGTHTVEDVHAMLAAGQAQILFHDEGVVVTQILQKPRMRVCQVWLAAGTMHAMRALHPAVIAFAREHGCQRVQFNGRPGWERTFLTRDDGWKPGLVTFTKEL